MRRTPQYELPVAGQIFNLAGDMGVDPWRETRERMEAAARAEQARAYQAKMQRILSECPGFVGADAPESSACTGKIVVEPSHVIEASEWLKRRFHVAESVEVDRTADGIVFEIAPRVRSKSTGARKVKVRFGPAEQFTLGL